MLLPHNYIVIGLRINNFITFLKKIIPLLLFVPPVSVLLMAGRSASFPP
jgi:hypothetical protein